LVPSPFGERYLADHARTIQADETQVVGTMWRYNPLGYHSTDGAYPPYPDGCDWIDELLLGPKWYKFGRDMAQVALKYKHLPLAQAYSTNVIVPHLKCAHDGIASLVTLFEVSKMFSFSDGMHSLYEYLPRKMSRIRKIWDRWKHIWLPPKYRAEAILDGHITYVPYKIPPHIRTWQMEAGTDFYGGASDFTHGEGEYLTDILLDNDALDEFIENAFKCLLFCEGDIQSDSDLSDDHLYSFDLIRMCQDIPNHKWGGMWTQGMPDNRSLMPGPYIEPIEDMYCNAFGAWDTKGLSTDAYTLYPVVGMADARGLVPIRRISPNFKVDDFTLFGAAKFGLIGENQGTEYDDYTQVTPLAFFGTKHQVASNATNWLRCNSVQVYTREDGWVTVDGVDVDWGDGADIRGYINSKSPSINHIYFPHVFKAQLTTNQEYTFLSDEKITQIHMWVPPEDIVDHHITMLSSIFQVPYAGGVLAPAFSGGGPAPEEAEEAQQPG
jgi:hypothetical protein